MNELQKLQSRIREFVSDRDWDQFHSPKNLSMALIAEAAELIEHFQWLTEEQSAQLPPDTLAEVSHELSDIFVYLLRLSDKLGINLIDAANKKMDINEQKYPAEKVRGSSKKYTAYQE